MTCKEMAADVPIVEISCSPGVANAALGFVAAKDEIDALGRKMGGRAIVGHLFPEWRGNGSIGPHCFASQVLPFFRKAQTEEIGAAYKAMVPTAVVIGESHAWWPDNLDEQTQLHVVEKVFAAFDASTPERAAHECAQYSYIKPLGIVLAHEGKNRVALFKKRDIPHIPALVTDRGYLPPTRIRIFELTGGNLAVLDGRYVERVRALNLIRSLMEAYGIEVESRWPTKFPPLGRVLTEFDDTRFQFGHEKRTVDMEKLLLDAAADEVEVSATLLDINAVKLPAIKTWLQGLALLPALILACKFTVGRWPDAQTLLSLLIGALCMLLVVPALPLVRCKVRHLKDQERMRQFVEAKNRIVRARELEAREVGHTE